MALGSDQKTTLLDAYQMALRTGWILFFDFRQRRWCVGRIVSGDVVAFASSLTIQETKQLFLVACKEKGVDGQAYLEKTE